MKSEEKIFELRVYTVIPKQYPKLIKLWEEEGKPIIKKYMNCIGVWNTESGQLNKIYHLYEWQGYNQRDDARHNFYIDKNAKSYVKKVKPLYQTQESYILKALPKLY